MEYLNDNLVDSIGLDQFGHLEIAKEIGKIITENSEFKKSITVGVFGKWGVGKSSVIHLLRTEVLKENANDIIYIDIPIWKYNDPKSIRRKFIYQIAKKLNQEEEIKKIYYEISNEGTINLITKLKNIIRNVQYDLENLLFYVLALITTGFVIYFLLKEFNLNFLLFFNSALSIAVITFILKMIQNIEFSKVREVQKVYEGEEQFEQLVENCLNPFSQKKIFIIDDLDRCDSSRILSVFEVIKNFIGIENCVFIIACDPDVIRKAIDIATKSQQLKPNSEASLEHSKNSGSYLEKIFQYVIEIPGFLPQNMRDYAKKQIISSDIELFKCDKLKGRIDQIIYTLIYKDTFNPRKVKTLINKFILNYKLASSLEVTNKSFLSEGIITDFPERLAFFSVIKSEFPHIIEDLKNAPSYNFREWLFSIEDEDFRTYVNQNIELFNEDWNILPFLYFNNDPSIDSLKDTQLKNFQHLSLSIRNGDQLTIEKLITKTQDVEDFIRYTFKQIEILNNNVEINNAVKIFLYLVDKIDHKALLLDRNDSSASKLHAQIIELIKSKGIFLPGFITYIALLLNYSKSKATMLLTYGFSKLEQPCADIVEIMFNEKHFEVFNENMSNTLIDYLKPTSQNLPELMTTINKVRINEANYKYFIDAFIEICKNYNLTLTSEIPSYDINVIEPIYFKILKLSLKINLLHFDSFLQSSTPRKKLYDELQNDIQSFSTESVERLLISIIKLHQSNQFFLIDESTLQFFSKAVSLKTFSKNVESLLDIALSKEIEEIDLYKLEGNLILKLLDFLSICMQVQAFHFHRTRVVLQNLIQFDEDVSISVTLFNWVEKNFDNEFDPTEVLMDELNTVFNSPSFLKSSDQEDEIIKSYFKYLLLYINNSIGKDIKLKTDQLEEITSTHTLSQKNVPEFSVEFLNQLFSLIFTLHDRGLFNFEKSFFYIISNYNQYAADFIEILITTWLRTFKTKEGTYKSDSKEISSINIVVNSTLPEGTRFKLYVYRSLICDTWWPHGDIDITILIVKYHDTLPPQVKIDFLKDVERKFNRILSPTSWEKGKDWSLLAEKICTSFQIISKIYKFDSSRLFKSIDSAINFYSQKNGYVEIIKSLIKLLNAECIPGDIEINKARITKNVRLVIQKYKKIRNGEGASLIRKFNLKIGKSYFQK